MKKVTFLLIIGTLLLSACGIKVPGIVTGSGKMLTKTFNVHDFDQIRLSTSGMLYIQQGNTFNLTVETDDNILPLLYVEEEQGVLTIRTRPITILQFETIIYHVT